MSETTHTESIFPSSTAKLRFTPKSVAWSSEALLTGLLPEQIQILPECKAAIRGELWRNLIAEYDAVHLSKYIHEKSLLLSNEFLEFEKYWLRDELNHYVGLRKIYSAIYSEDENDLQRQVLDRIPDFRRIDKFLGDEFTICVCFAYDELASARGYVDVFNLYESFKVPTLASWIKFAARDEMYHSINAMNIIKAVFPQRLEEVPAILRSVVENEHSDPDDYQATFLFDHGEDKENNPFSKQFLKQCANDICKWLSTASAFEMEVEV